MNAETAKCPLDTQKLIEICRQHDVVKLGVFGSTARGEAGEQSDIDLLVQFSKRKSLLALVSLERKIAAALGRKVDLLTEAAISPYLRESIMRDLQVIYEAGCSWRRRATRCRPWPRRTRPSRASPPAST